MRNDLGSGVQQPLGKFVNPMEKVVKAYSESITDVAKGGPGSGPHPGGGGAKPQYKVKQTVHSYNHTTNQDSTLRAGTLLHHVGSSDKGEIFRHADTGHEHSVDHSETGPKYIGKA